MAKINDDMKRAPAISVEVSLNTDVLNDPNNGLRLAFANGQTLTLQVGDLTESVVAYAALHGLKQKLVDAAAIARNPDTGRSATIEDKYDAVKAVYDRLLSGQWNAPRGEGGTGTGGLLFRALCEMYPAKTPTAIREFLAAKNAKEQAALRKNPRVAAIIDRLRAATTDDDGEELLGELE